VDIGFEGGDEVFRGLFAEAEDVVDASEGGNDGHAVFEGINGPVGGFVEGADTVIGIEGNHEEVAEVFCLLEVLNVSGVEDIENPVGEDEFFVFSFFLNLAEGFLIHWSKREWARLVTLVRSVD